MKKPVLLILSLSCLLATRIHAQNIISSRMNEVFLKSNLSTTTFSNPWEITYGPDDSLWITDAKLYKVYKMDPVTAGGTKKQILDLSETSTFTPSSFRRTFNSSQNPWPQGGLAGLVIHPEFMTNPLKRWVYISYVRSYDSTSVTPSGGAFFTNRIVRFTYNPSNGQLENPVSLVDTLPGSNDHNSQRMIIAPVNNVYYLFYGSGDMGAGQLSSRWRVNHAQDTTYYQGKILRFNLDVDGDAGALDQWIPNDNPYNHATQSAVWCLGIRNNQGFAYDSVRNILYGSSHGPYSDDEVNIIEPSRNYGHPLVIGYAADENYAGASAGYYPTSTLPTIVSEMSNVAAIGPSYKDPLFAGYSRTTHVIDSIWTNNPGNGGWPSEAWSGLGLYNYSMIPGWKNSLLMAGLKWGRMIRTKLTSSGTGIAQIGGLDTVCYFDGLPRYRDMAFGPNGKDIFLVMEAGNSTIAPLAPSVNNPALGSCASCVQKFTFLGYNNVGGTSAIPTTVPVAAGLANTCENGNTVTINSTNNNIWVPITDTNSNVIAEVLANGNNLGKVSASVYSNLGPLRETSSNKSIYMDRNVTLTSEFLPSATVAVRFYMNGYQFNNLKNGQNSLGQASGVATISNLAVFKNNDNCTPAAYAVPTALPTTNQAAFDTNFVVQANVTIGAYSSYYFAASTSLLPINSLTFKGSLLNSIGQLTWTTQDEQNTKLFTLERSTDGRDFYPVNTISASRAAGQAYYAFNDSAVSKLASQVLYYRLKLVNDNGQFSYSQVVVLNLNATKSLINIRPNPVLNDVTLTVEAATTEKGAWQITDVTGKTVMQHALPLNKGTNETKINISSLPAGIYYLKVTGASISQSIKLQKL